MGTEPTDEGWVMWDGGAREEREPAPPIRVSVPVSVPVPETDDWLMPPSENGLPLTRPASGV